MIHYVYILECADMTLYTGAAKDAERRVNEHNTSKAGARYTRSRRPVRLVYLERCFSLSEALKREAMIKKLPRAAKLELIKTGGFI